MWEIAAVNVRDKDKVESYLRENYEPFAVIGTSYGDTVWFKRKVKDEVHSDKPTRVKSGASKRATTESKEEVSP